MKHILLLAALLLNPALAWAAQAPDEYMFDTTDQARVKAQSFIDTHFTVLDGPDDQIIVSASQYVNAQNIFFILSSSGLKLCYIAQFSGGFHKPVQVVPLDFNHAHKQYVAFVLPSGQTGLYNLVHSPL